MLSEQLGPVGIAVVQLSITDFQFSAAFQQAIEAKVTAVQQTLEAENPLSRRVQFEAKPKVTQVQAEAKGLELQKTQVTPELIRPRQIEVQRAAVQKCGRHPKMSRSRTQSHVVFPGRSQEDARQGARSGIWTAVAGGH